MCSHTQPDAADGVQKSTDICTSSTPQARGRLYAEFQDGLQEGFPVHRYTGVGVNRYDALSLLWHCWRVKLSRQRTLYAWTVTLVLRMISASVAVVAAYQLLAEWWT